MKILKKIIKRIFRFNRDEHEPDKVLVVIIGIILFCGLLVLSSASAVAAYSKFGSSYYYFIRQVIYLVLGGFLFWVFSNFDYHRWKKYAVVCLLASVALLCLVFVPGIAAGYGSARSWINIFGFGFQPSELVKIFFLIYIAAWLDRKRDLNNPGEGLVPFLSVLGIITFLMIMQPDIGTLSIIALSSLAVYFIGGGRTIYITGIIFAGLLALFMLVKIYPYQMDRFRCVMDSDYNIDKECYQLNQSLIAVGSGGFFGRGLGQSRQKFMYLPEVSSDSIFAIIAEEVGSFFSSILVVLYLIIFYRGAQIAKKAPDMFGRVLSAGIVFWVMIQTFL
ncbi:hypothetical protein GF382_03405, partial [Candidatus Falkowbacteria bacterium]|nr:hypothetical protein [Candidatus Falkowbacteria bacterium]